MKLDSESMEAQQQQQQSWQPKSDDRGAALLAKMGYGGGGLGKSGQGRTEPIPLSTQRGRIGLGHQANQVFLLAFLSIPSSVIIFQELY